MEIVIGKKQIQLGMNPSTASGRLVKDILYKFIVDTGKNLCYHCGQGMTRETFTIEHKIPWLDSESPLELYFDLDNISFSHHACNVGASRKSIRAVCGTSSKYNKGCRCDSCKEACRLRSAERYKPDVRKAQYSRTGK